MLNLSKSNTSQKGFSPILIIVSIVVLGLLAVGALKVKVNNTNPSSSNNNSLVNQKPIDVLDVTQNETYAFYYPKGYIKEEGKDYALLYSNPQSKAVVAESVFLYVGKLDQKIAQKPTYEFCKNFAERTFRTKEDDEIKAEVAFGGFGGGKGVGCKIVAISKIDGVNDATVIVEKNLWNEEGSDTIHRVRAVYYQNASKEQDEILKLAVDMFTLK